ncbi:MAG: GNAT family N-acetyltransferase [Bacillota bacterium]|nr:GNAT family N-acetyltransferase [Bacillota bacterium]
MIEFDISTNEQRNELSEIYKFCFHEGSAQTDFFFDNHWNEQNGIIAKSGSEIVAALYLLSTRILTPSGITNAHYLYGAATKPQYRNRGIMQNLIDFANRTAHKGNQQYSILLPASDSLYNFYMRCGYRPLYKIREVKLSAFELKEFATPSEKKSSFNIANCINIRNQFCSKHLGSVLWNKDDFSYAVGINKLYGGEIIVSENGYALCSKVYEDKLTVTEIISDEDSFSDIAHQLLQTGANNFVFRLPVWSNLLYNKGKEIPFGMIRHTLNNDNIGFLENEKPYIGLTLD